MEGCFSLFSLIKSFALPFFQEVESNLRRNTTIIASLTGTFDFSYAKL